MMLLAVNNSWVHSHTTIFPDHEYFPICSYILIPLTQFGYFHPSLMFLQKSIWICSLQCHITIKRFPHQRQNLFPNFSSSIFPFSSVSTLAEKMVGMHTLMTILSPIMKISRFFPNCAQSDCQSSAMLPLAPPVGSIQSFFPSIWGQQVW